MVVSLWLAVVDPGLLQISGEIGFAMATVPNPTSRVSETTVSDRILIRFLPARDPTSTVDNPMKLMNQYP